MTTGERLRTLRKELGISADDVAKALGVSRATIFRYEKGDIEKVPGSVLEPLSKILHTTPAYLMGWESDDQLPTNAIPYHTTGMAPVLGRIPAGAPLLAKDDIEGYEPVDASDPSNYYWLRVQGDSMINAGINSGDLVLIHVQNYAENGQIVACRVNGDEATLKRYREQKASILLMPENPDYEPYVVSKKDFNDGYAGIMGVAVEIKRKL